MSRLLRRQAALVQIEELQRAEREGARGAVAAARETCAVCDDARAKAQNALSDALEDWRIAVSADRLDPYMLRALGSLLDERRAALALAEADAQKAERALDATLTNLARSQARLTQAERLTRKVRQQTARRTDETRYRDHELIITNKTRAS
jgi:hypothetical protein